MRVLKISNPPNREEYTFWGKEMLYEINSLRVISTRKFIFWGPKILKVQKAEVWTRVNSDGYFAKNKWRTVKKYDERPLIEYNDNFLNKIILEAQQNL